MATSDVEILELYLLSLTNAGSQPTTGRCFSNMDSTASCRELRKSIVSIRPHRCVESGINYVYLFLSGLKIITYGH